MNLHCTLVSVTFLPKLIKKSVLLCKICVHFGAFLVHTDTQKEVAQWWTVRNVEQTNNDNLTSNTLVGTCKLTNNKNILKSLAKQTVVILKR